ncbi:AAA family ATPase [Caballeronia sp. TF1N1]|uniref:DUF4435 domain-containing protein n=1 Tax=Caballeronia sp. TF1N1 TaxID=2878153 RepID=UPI001FD5CDB4|nr:AAA family ATPase [Caballeronia sp. TF1N1]
MQSRTFVLPKAGVAFDQNSEWPADKCTALDVQKSVVIVGANGSGKTRLGTWIDLYSPQKESTLRVSAQRSLTMPDSSQLISLTIAESDLIYGYGKATENQNPAGYKLGNRWASNGPVHILNDFPKLMVYLFSEQADVSAKYLADSRLSEKRIPPPVTKLEQIKNLWETLLPHRELVLGGAELHTKIANSDGTPYKASQMSDGERVLFYLVGQCLAAPKSGIIIVDEPEVHLHKSLQSPLWNAIENLRADCLFVYITHDVDFAASQVAATKLWLKGFDGASWDWATIDDVDDMPDDLLLEIMGSRKPVVFVEGDNGSHDVALYRALLPECLVMPRGSCSAVIAGVRALRDNKQFHHLDIVGVIDRDRRGDEEIQALGKDGIHVLDVAEVENLFCTREVLALCSTRLARDAQIDFDKIVKLAFERLNAELETQVSMRVAAEIKYRLNLFDVKAKGPGALDDAVKQTVADIDVSVLYSETEGLFVSLISQNDYNGLLKYYNRKSLASQIGATIGLANKELPALVLRIASGDGVHAIREAVRPYFGDFKDKIPVKPTEDPAVAEPSGTIV